MGRMKAQVFEEAEQVAEEYVVYRVGGANVWSGFVDAANAILWDAHVKRMAEDNRPLTLTLLARGLTKAQAHQFVELSREETE